jgi:hypothetical protein
MPLDEAEADDCKLLSSDDVRELFMLLMPDMGLSPPLRMLSDGPGKYLSLCLSFFLGAAGALFFRKAHPLSSRSAEVRAASRPLRRGPSHCCSLIRFFAS